MTVEECRKKIKDYTEHSKSILERAMNIIECDNELNDIEDEEIDSIYKKLSNAIKAIESI